VLLAFNTALAAQSSHQHPKAPEFDRDTAFAISQAALGNTPDDLIFTAANGKQTPLSKFKGKPLVISMIYTSCYHICPTTTKHLHRVVRKARAALGTDTFNVLTIGFDVVKDSPQMMQFFADKQRISDANWYFLSADQDTIDSLSASLGFIYFPSPNGFDHLIQATILDESGTVFRQVYGMDFETPHLIEPLKRFVFKTTDELGLLDSVSNRVRLFCTVYDPSEDKYRFDYSLFIGMFIGALCVGSLGFQLIREWRKSLSV
jgi:protein SCO1